MNTPFDPDFAFDDYMMSAPYSKMQGYDAQLYPNVSAVSYDTVPVMAMSSQPLSLPYHPSSPSSSESSTSPVTPSITEKLAQVPESFLPEFHQYSKETYESGAGKKRRRTKKDDSEEDEAVSAAELRRQVHIQSEQKRRAQIKDGFEELRQHLPGCVTKKMSKAAMLHRTVQHLQHLKKNQNALLAELERLVQENEQLKRFQESVLEKQALEKMYQIGTAM